MDRHQFDKLLSWTSNNKNPTTWPRNAKVALICTLAILATLLFTSGRAPTHLPPTVNGGSVTDDKQPEPDRVSLPEWIPGQHESAQRPDVPVIGKPAAAFSQLETVAVVEPTIPPEIFSSATAGAVEPTARPQVFSPATADAPSSTAAPLVEFPEHDIAGGAKEELEELGGTEGSFSLRSTWKGWHAIENIFVFGDSYPDTYFKAMDEQPNATHPFGNHGRLNKHSVFTPKWPQFMAATHNESYVRAWNYAIIGSTVDKQVVPSWGLSSDLKGEIARMFEAAAKPKLKPYFTWKAEDALFAFAMGVNDINLSDDIGKEVPYDASIAAYTRSLHTLYEKGARNFLLLNLPPIDRIMKKDSAFVGPGIVKYNRLMKQMRLDLMKNATEANVFLFDLHTMMLDILDDPQQFEETKPITDFGPWLGTCNSCEFAEPGRNMTNVDCETKGAWHFWCEWMHIGYSVHNATSARIVEDCFTADRRPSRYCT